ncbi:MAG TPA: hypothetical protein VJA25_01995, partial [Dehalococcoidia bacterium]|nr:hypothetical protein [Dehalococcoidia bacterium]
MPLMTSASLLERAAGRGGAPLPSEAISRPEDRYPGLSELIRRMREKYRLDDTTIVQLLTRGEELFKANLPKDITPAQVDVEVFGRKPGLITRATAAAGKGWLSPAMRGLESSVGLPKGSIAIPEDVEAQASYMGGLPKLAGQFGRDLPLAAATGGASKLLSLAPLKTDLLVGGVLGAAQPMLEEGRLPTLGEVGTSAGLVGGAGALLRRLLPTSKALKPGESAKRVEPDILQPGGQPPVEGPDLIRMLGG